MPPQVVGRHHHLGTQMPSGGVHPITAHGVTRQPPTLPRPLLRGVEQAHGPALAHHVHRTAGLGSPVLINETWYKLLFRWSEPIEDGNVAGTARLSIKNVRRLRERTGCPESPPPRSQILRRACSD